MNVKIFLATLLLAIMGLQAYAEDIPRKEYPRPQFERTTWMNLNGQWDYTFDFSNTGMERNYPNATGFEQKITVPFCPESSLSGVGHKDFINHIWYHREFSIPAEWAQKKILLNFGAVYFNSEIYIDGTLAGRHFGGSSSFSIDITGLTVPGKKHHLVVHASSDLRSGKQSAGKQCLQYTSYACNYTRTTGIWQTVWLEAVAPVGLQSAQIITDIDQRQVVIFPKFYSDSPCLLKVTLKEGNKVVSTASVKASQSSVVILPVKKPKLWSPESPFLYDIVYQVTDPSGKLVDEVHSYTGMRKIHIEGNKIYLNNKPYYQRLVLDQGFYPDGIWTAPSDAALKKDIELSMAAGFNGARLHQKAFEERFYYWADKLGYLTWGEAPSWGMDANDVEVARNFLTEWSELVIRDRNHPSLITWTPMNEEFWPDKVQYPRFTTDLYNLTKSLDPTRPVNDASGGCHIKTDIWTVHNYEQDPYKLKNLLYKDGKFFQTPNYSPGVPASNIGYNGLRQNSVYPFPEYDGKMPYLIDEVGGIKWVKGQDKTNSDTQSWGYGEPPKTEQEFLQRMEGQIYGILDLSDHVWGYCYTQLTDVEQEQNGIYYYDRTPKFDTEKIHAIFSTNPEDIKDTYTNPLADYGPDPWAIWHNGYYYYMHTMGDRLVLWKTRDITDIRNAEKKTVWMPTDPTNKYDLWAPEIHHIDGKWYIYYAADDGNTDNHQMYVLENTHSDPFQGEFTMKGRISTDKDNNWAIDGSVFEHQGKLYMVWSGWQTRRVDTETQCIYIARMANPWTLDSERVLISKPELEWERHYKNVDGSEPSHKIFVNEGPQPLKSPQGKYIHIVYSASGVWTPYYALGMLTAPADADLLNPASWQKSPQPLFKQSPENSVYGTGHNSFFKSPDGKEDYILYHARDTQTDPPGMGDTRTPRAQKIEWDSNDYPVFGIPYPKGKRLKKPSGTVTGFQD